MVSEVDSDDIVVVGEEAMDLLPWQRWWWRVLVCRIGVDKKRSGKHAATIRQLECGHGAREFVLLDDVGASAANDGGSTVREHT